MTKKLTAWATPTMKIMVVAPPERKHSVSIGRSILFFQHIPAVVDLEGEYDGFCPTIALRKCFLTCRFSEQQCCFEIDSVFFFLSPA